MRRSERTRHAALTQREPIWPTMEAVFHEGPVFRMGFDRHVRDWKRHIGKQAMRAFNSDPAWRAAYYARGGTFGRGMQA